MRKPFAYLAIAILGLSLTACGSAKPTQGPTTTTPGHTPSASSTPSTAPAAKQATPTRTTPLAALTDPDILGYCPDTPAVHFDGAANEVTKIRVCTSVTSADGIAETAYDVNYGQEALLSAYGAPNALLTKDSCVRVAKDPLIIWLTLKDGTIHPVYAPVDHCGYPSANAEAAYQAAGLQILWEADFDLNGNPVTP
jgi:hypothetical protein